MSMFATWCMLKEAARQSCFLMFSHSCGCLSSLLFILVLWKTDSSFIMIHPTCSMVLEYLSTLTLKIARCVVGEYTKISGRESGHEKTNSSSALLVHHVDMKDSTPFAPFVVSLTWSWFPDCVWKKKNCGLDGDARRSEKLEKINVNNNRTTKSLIESNCYLMLFQ